MNQIKEEVEKSLRNRGLLYRELPVYCEATVLTRHGACPVHQGLLLILQGMLRWDEPRAGKSYTVSPMNNTKNKSIRAKRHIQLSCDGYSSGADLIYFGNSVALLNLRGGFPS